MSQYADAGSLADKVEWEGGVPAMLWGYGLAAEDMPDDLPVEVRTALALLLSDEVSAAMQVAEVFFEELCEQRAQAELAENCDFSH